MNLHRPVAFAVIGVVLAGLAGCSSGINTMTAPTTATRVTRFSGFPIDDPSPIPMGLRAAPVCGRGYGYSGG